MKYLLPCPQCGETHPVDSTQAGEQITCRCGQRVEVPSLRGLRELERADAGPPAKTAAHQAPGRSGELIRRLVCVLGLMLVVLGLAVAAYGGVGRARLHIPDAPVDDAARADEAIDALSPRDAHGLWSEFRSGGLGPYYEPMHHLGQRVQNFYTRVLLVGLTIAGVGLVAAIGAMLVPGGRPAQSNSRKA